MGTQTLIYGVRKGISVAKNAGIVYFSTAEFHFYPNWILFPWLTPRTINCSEEQNLIKFTHCVRTIPNLLYILPITSCIFSK